MLGRVASQLLGCLLLADVRLSVVIPTITGREESLLNIRRAYRDTLGDLPHEIIVVKDEPSWPRACNVGYEKSRGECIHFTADDLEPLPGWWRRTLARLWAFDELPAAKVMNHSADGPWDNWMDGEDGALTHFTRVPIMTREQYVSIGPWPETLDYAADVWVSERARTIGIQTRMLHSYAFVHHWSQIGRIDTPEVLAGAAAELDRLRAQGLQRCS